MVELVGGESVINGVAILVLYKMLFTFFSFNNLTGNFLKQRHTPDLKTVSASYQFGYKNSCNDKSILALLTIKDSIDILKQGFVLKGIA